MSVTMLKPLNASNYPNVPAVEIDRLNGMRKIVTMSGGVEAVHKAFNAQASKPIGLSTFNRYMRPGSAKARKVTDFLHS